MNWGKDVLMIPGQQDTESVLCFHLQRKAGEGVLYYWPAGPLSRDWSEMSSLILKHGSWDAILLGFLPECDVTY